MSNELISMSNAIKSNTTRTTAASNTMASKNSTQPIIPANPHATNTQSHSNRQLSPEIPNERTKKRGLNLDDPNRPQGDDSPDDQQNPDLRTNDLAKRLGTDNDDQTALDDEVRIIKPVGKPSDNSQNNKTALSRREDEAIARIIKKCLTASKAGDQATSDKFYEMYKSIVTSKAKSKTANEPRNGSKPTPENAESSDEDSMAGDVQFVTGAVPKHDEMGFTPYFHKNIKTMRGPIPLTIFNKAWKNRAILYHAEKKSKFDDSSSDRNRYTGLPYPSEWTQTFTEWTNNHQSFHKTLVEEFDYKKMAKWLLAHKANADALVAEDGFMVALRYDVQVRTNAFAHQVLLPDGSLLVADISVLRPKIAHSCYATARKFGELEFTDNPYAENGVRSNWDPTTGQPKLEKKPQVIKANTANATQGPSSLPQRPQPARAPKSHGYKGNNYNPNHGSRPSDHSSKHP
ncbi:hypothetical protein PGT21_008829 [Puccinia graminis f. sp. tritici]|uniref:Uncharacterized protein n=1 Tax=Puccinia graminis f. sp. tritici TaxID=56615 RepID=A0A5B0S3X9_PUCGR|nr:hypothetical protein PGT21_008829 [Puccinia graminis f. sp. tritici]KAA1131434.1 hypothetical protein PGTUg99_013982 [Puccinia graminis f. sp. tritici]